MTSTKYYESWEFRKEQKAWYSKLAKGGFYDIESGLDNPPLLKPHHTTLQAKQRLGEDVWLDTLSEPPTGGAGKERYAHYAALIAAQEYALCRLGPFRHASETRASWALHAQGVSERDIARDLGIHRWDVEKYVAQLYDIIVRAVAQERSPW